MAWESKRLDEIATIQTGPFGSQLHQKDYVDVGIPIITVEHLGQYRIKRQNLPRVTSKDANRLQKYSLLPGDIVFSRVGSVDQCSYVCEAESGWLFSGRCLRVRPEESKADPLFIYYSLNTVGLKNYIRAIAVGATMPSINTAILSEIPISVPALDEQHRIAEVLGSLDDKIAASQRTASLSREIARAVGEATRTLASLGELAVRNKRTVNPAKLGSNLVTHYSIPRFDSGSPALEPADAIKSNKMHVERASVLVSKLNPDTPRVWSIPAPSGGPFPLASTEFIVLEPCGINQSQLYAATLHPNFHQQLASMVGGTSKSHQRVKPEEMLNCVVPDVRTLPTTQVELLETVVQIEDKAIREAETLAKTRDELLPLLMSGKITVKEASQEAAAVGAQIPSKENEV
ncbi:restriction endonuclease subunit S [uncultured Corynebacterium sp.]|uniref:restriction endonuclease subunit S n=1 Tax=uncultured Corynebacterium sp. TaxID=159447 RepID=UPI0025F5D98F|nr:restriction endonuclease subunit S [uncultured Corynebacterium sp.]